MVLNKYLRTRNVGWFPASYIDIPANNLEKAKDFYSRLFDCKMGKVPKGEFCIVQKTNFDGADVPKERIWAKDVDKGIKAYIGVHSVDEYIAKVEALGGTIITQKITLSGCEHLAICMDTANNIFNIWKKTQKPNEQLEQV